MVDWTLLDMEESIDCNSIGKGFVAMAAKIGPDRNPSQFRRLFGTYKEAMRNAIRQNAINSGKRAEDLDFDFSDERHLPEFMSILENVLSSELNNSPAVWKALIEDSDYRNLQRTQGFIEGFDRRMSGVGNLEPRIWEYLVNHFTVYGFATQNKELVEHLKGYGGIAGKKAAAPVEPVVSKEPEPIVVTAPYQPAKQVGMSPLLQQYLKMQDEGIVSRLLGEFMTKLDRICSHDVTKNNLSAWRYLFQDERYVMLLRQVHFTEILARRMQNVDGLYPAIWEYIIDKTKVPEAHPMYSKTTGYLIGLSKSNAFTGQVLPQPILPAESLSAYIDRDDYSKGHLDYQPVGSKKKSAGNSRWVWWLLFIILIMWRLFWR